MRAPNLVRHGPRAAMLLVAACAAGCAAPPKGEASWAAQAAGDDTRNSPSVLAVRAFAELCGSLRAESVAQRARTYAFIPLEAAPRAEALQAEMRAKGLRGWVRPVPGAPALLTWSEQARSCELAVGGIDLGEVEREFGVMASALERNGLAVTRVSPQAPASGPLLLRQAMVISPRGLAPYQPRSIALRANTNPAQSIQAVLTMRPLILPAPAAGPTPPPDDAVPAE